MLVVSFYYRVGEALSCEGGIEIYESEWYVEIITEVTLLGPIEGSIECSSLEIFEWDSEVANEQQLLGLKDNIN